jgi:hypothetical protein
MKTAKFITEITIIDPDSGGDVLVSIYKHENDGIFGIDSSYIEQVIEDDDEFKIPDVFNYTGKKYLKLIY